MLLLLHLLPTSLERKKEGIHCMSEVSAYFALSSFDNASSVIITLWSFCIFRVKKKFLYNASLKVLKQTMKMGVITSTSSSSYFLLSQLEWLCLEEVNDLFLCASVQYGQRPKRIKRKRDASKVIDIQDN